LSTTRAAAVESQRLNASVMVRPLHPVTELLKYVTFQGVSHKDFWKTFDLMGEKGMEEDNIKMGRSSELKVDKN
jgi:hypothetical protein